MDKSFCQPVWERDKQEQSIQVYKCPQKIQRAMMFFRKTCSLDNSEQLPQFFSPVFMLSPSCCACSSSQPLSPLTTVTPNSHPNKSQLIVGGWMSSALRPKGILFFWWFCDFYYWFCFASIYSPFSCLVDTRCRETTKSSSERCLVSFLIPLPCIMLSKATLSWRR